MITTGLALATLTATGFYLIFRKLPRRIRRFMNKHVLFTDTIVCLLTYMILGGTLVALFAAAFMGIITSLMLSITSNPVTNDLLERFTSKLGELKSTFIGWVEKCAPQKKQPDLKVA